jgi:hypothetical protein
MSEPFGFEWTRFLKVALLFVAMPGLLLVAQSRAGGLDAASASAPLACLSLLAFFAFRWSRLRRDFAAGEFTEAEFRTNPFRFVMGRPVVASVWFCATFVLALLPLAWWAYTHVKQP